MTPEQRQLIETDELSPGLKQITEQLDQLTRKMKDVGERGSAGFKGVRVH